VEKFGTARHKKYNNITLHMRFAYWLVKDRDTHSDCVQLFDVNNSYTTAPQYYGFT